MSSEHRYELLREHQRQIYEREEATRKPLTELLAALPPLTDAQRQAQARARLLQAGPGLATDNDQ